MILFCDDFMGYGTNSALLLNGLWGAVGFNITADIDPNVPAGTKAAHFAGFGNNGRRVFLAGSTAIIGVALRHWLTALPNFTTNFIRMLDGNNQVQCAMAITATGVIQIVRGGMPGAAVLGATPVPVLTANAYHHIEFKVTAGAANDGHAEVRVDGVSVLKVDNVTTGVCLQVGFGNTQDNGDGTPARDEYIKDLVVWNGQGAHNNDFIGTCSVIDMTPDSDVELGWTPSTGQTGYNLVNQSPPDDANKYLTAPYPPPPPSEFTLTDLPLNVSSVKALMTQVRARKADGGDGNVQTSLISAGTPIAGADRPMTTAFTYYEDVFETDPHTGGNWTPASADAAQIEINRTQ